MTFTVSHFPNWEGEWATSHSVRHLPSHTIRYKWSLGAEKGFVLCGKWTVSRLNLTPRSLSLFFSPLSMSDSFSWPISKCFSLKSCQRHLQRKSLLPYNGRRLSYRCKQIQTQSSQLPTFKSQSTHIPIRDELFVLIRRLLMAHLNSWHW